jgi:hypothetical protein
MIAQALMVIFLVGLDIGILYFMWKNIQEIYRRVIAESDGRPATWILVGAIYVMFAVFLLMAAVLNVTILTDFGIVS